MPEITEVPKLRRVQVREILRRHRGSIVALARHIGVTDEAIHIYLRGRTTSARIAAAAEERALELLEIEKQEGAA